MVHVFAVLHPLPVALLLLSSSDICCVLITCMFPSVALKRKLKITCTQAIVTDCHKQAADRAYMPCSVSHVSAETAVWVWQSVGSAWRLLGVM